MEKIKSYANRPAVLGVLLAVIVIGFYAPALKFSFVQFDEEDHISNRQLYLRKAGTLIDAFKHDSYYPSGVSQYYRPLHAVSYMLDVIGPGISFFRSHAINIILHVITVLLIFWLFWEFGFSRLAAFFSTLIFAIHPVATRVVAWVPGRNEAILAIFAIASFIAFIRFVRNGHRIALMVHALLFLAALLSKETAVVIPVVCVLWYWLARNPIFSLAAIRRNTIAAIWLSIYVAWIALRSIGLRDMPSTPFLELINGVFTRLDGFALYIQKAVIPINPEVFPVFGRPDLIFGVTAIACLLILFFVARKKHFIEKKKVLFGILWFFVWLIPAMIGYESAERSIWLEHRLYIPIVGLIYIGGSVLWREILFLKRKIGWIILIILCGSLAVFSVIGMRQFRNTEVFWKQAVADAPLQAKSHKGLGLVYARQGKSSDALNEFNRALEINPSEKRVHNDIGIIYLQQQQAVDASEEFEKEIAVNPTYAIAYNNLAFSYATRQRFGEAEKAWLVSIALNPWYNLPHQGLAILYAMLGKREPALEQIEALKSLGAPILPEIQKIYDNFKNTGNE